MPRDIEERQLGSPNLAALIDEQDARNHGPLRPNCTQGTRAVNIINPIKSIDFYAASSHCARAARHPANIPAQVKPLERVRTGAMQRVEARSGMTPTSWTRERSRSGGLAGVDLLEAHRAQVAKCGLQSLDVVNLVDEPWKPGDNVLDDLVAAQVHLPMLERLREALFFGIIKTITMHVHRTIEPAPIDLLPARLGDVLGPTIRMVEAGRMRPATGDHHLRGRSRQISVDPSACGPAHHQARPMVLDHGDEDEAAKDANVHQVGDTVACERTGPIDPHPDLEPVALEVVPASELVQACPLPQVILLHLPLELAQWGSKPKHTLAPRGPLRLTPDLPSLCRSAGGGFVHGSRTQPWPPD